MVRGRDSFAKQKSPKQVAAAERGACIGMDNQRDSCPAAGRVMRSIDTLVLKKAAVLPFYAIDPRKFQIRRRHFVLVRSEFGIRLQPRKKLLLLLPRTS